MLNDILEWVLAVLIVLLVAAFFMFGGVIVGVMMIGAAVTYVLAEAGRWFSSLFLSNEVREGKERSDTDADA